MTVKVVNPTDKRLEVVYRGNTYSVEANDEAINVPEEVASWWKTHIHTFIVVSKDEPKVEKKEEPKEEKTEVKEPVKKESKVSSVKSTVKKTLKSK